MKTKYLLWLLLAVCWITTGCNKRGAKESDLISGIDTNMTYRVAVMVGSTHDKYVTSHFPAARVERLEQEPDLLIALESGQADMVIMDESVYKLAHAGTEKFKVLETLFSEDFGVGFSLNNTALRDEFNRFLAGIKADGTYNQILSRWFDEYEKATMPDLGEAPKGPPLRMGTTSSMEGFAFIQNGKPAGFDVEIMERFSRFIGRPVEYSLLNFGGLIAALASGKVDVISAGMTITEERAKQVAFSDCYFKSSSIALILKERDGMDAKPHKEIKNIEDLNTAKVAIVSGLIYDKYVAEHAPGAEVVLLDTYPDVFMALESGKAAVMLVDGVIYETVLKKKGLHEVAFVLFEDPYGVGFNYNNPELRDQFNAFLEEIKQNGVYEEMTQRWIDHYDTAKMPDWPDQPKGKPLRLGCSGTTEAFDFIQDGRNAGFDIELVERFGRSIGRPIKFYNLKFGGLIAALSAGTVDMIASAMTITEERSKQVAYSNPYYVSQSLAVTLKKEKIPEIVYHSMEDIRDKRIGVLMSSTQDQYVTQTYPEAKILRIDLNSDLVMALKTKQCDAIVLPHPVANSILQKNTSLGLLEEDIYPVELGIGFGNAALRDQFNTFLSEMKRNGMYEAVSRRWTDSTLTASMPVLKTTPGAKSLVVGTSAESMPFAFLKDGVNSGLDMELMERFAASLGRPVEYRIMTFGGLIPAIVSGKIDVMASSAMLTEERKKQVAFSDPYYTIKSNVIALKENLGVPRGVPVETKSFTERVKESFYDNLVREKRYMLILKGLEQTVIITFFAVILGTVFGGFICFLRMSKNLVLNSFAKAYISVMRGTPILVLLMIFFYVVFASSGLNATVVAIFTFALNMAAYSSEMFRTSIEGIDRGQREAGIAMGFTLVQTYVYIILPQAIRNVLPVYKGEVISLLKTTSIVGYIAVVDLTKASDIIRSRTFDAFFPLIVVAVIYFALAGLLGFGLDCLNKKISSGK